MLNKIQSVILGNLKWKFWLIENQYIIVLAKLLLS